MGLRWPGAHVGGSELTDEDQKLITAVMDKFGDLLANEMSRVGLAPHMSPIWRPWSLVVVRDARQVFCAFSPSAGGLPELVWLDRPDDAYSAAGVATGINLESGREVSTVVALPKPGAVDEAEAISQAVRQHVREVQRMATLEKLGDISNVSYLEPQLRAFLNDHPEPDRNVFVMMRFRKSPQLDEAYAAIKETLAVRGFHGVRADDRDYTGELWSNIEVYMTCCKYGIAVFEDIDARDYNPNVSLELGYMIGRGRRCLILKEQRLPNLPADVIHRLYKPFDMFNVRDSVSREVGRFVDVDLGHKSSSWPNR